MIHSSVEDKALASSAYKAIYPPQEKMRALIADNFPAMGKLTALRFLEWCQSAPEGLVSLPTGKTPEHFIRWVQHLLQDWQTPEVRTLAEEYGLCPERPELRGLRFVQIDEFYPVLASQKNSFTWYVREFYLQGFGLDPERALLMDCAQIGLGKGESLADYWPQMQVDLSLRHRQPHTALERRQADMIARVDQWCCGFEEQVRTLGGLGFFLGGIGPDGHIGFNMRGSDHHSTTRLTVTNYETQAASAGDLGGIEIAQKRLVITIGLGTITYNPDCAAIIMAAGEAKAPMVRDAIESAPNVLYPATALQHLPNACFYITQGAAKLLEQRQLAQLQAAGNTDPQQVEKAIIDLSLARGKRIAELTTSDVATRPMAQATLAASRQRLEELQTQVEATLVARIGKGIAAQEGQTFLHTEPHHDDVMLGYMPAVVRAIRPASNRHYFATMTSGFTSVTNDYLRGLLQKLTDYLAGDPDYTDCQRDPHYFDPTNREGRNFDVWTYLDGIAAVDPALQDAGMARRMLRNLNEVYGGLDATSTNQQVQKILEYMTHAYPGQKDPAPIQKLKGMVREWESECLWGYFGWNTENIRHLRLGFYSGDIFTAEPERNRDVAPIIELCQKTAPDVVSLAFDPEGSGPDTHYKVMQAVTEALRSYATASGRTVRVWGYRNVWYRFHPAESNLYVPVSLNMFSVLESSFLNTYISQREASFPSYEYDGPFCGLARQIQVEQYRMLQTCLGREWFYEHPSPLIRATRGFVFLREMTLEELCHCSRELRKAQESD